MQPGTTGMDLFRSLKLFPCLMLAICSAHAGAMPDEIPGVETLTAEAGIEKANSKLKPVIIDAGINRDRKSGYIEESSSLSDINTNCDTLNKLVANKLKPRVFDCNDANCGRSVVAIKIARSCGYKSLSRDRCGFEEWRKKRYQTVTQDQAHR